MKVGLPLLHCVGIVPSTVGAYCENMGLITTEDPGCDSEPIKVMEEQTTQRDKVLVGAFNLLHLIMMKATGRLKVNTSKKLRSYPSRRCQDQLPS